MEEPEGLSGLLANRFLWQRFGEQVCELRIEIIVRNQLSCRVGARFRQPGFCLDCGVIFFVPPSMIAFCKRQ